MFPKKIPEVKHMTTCHCKIFESSIPYKVGFPYCEGAKKQRSKGGPSVDKNVHWTFLAKVPDSAGDAPLQARVEGGVSQMAYPDNPPRLETLSRSTPP
ncbi:hypothetical protein D3A96_03535 [Robertkochia marina]|nr:hypothetical protein D3A96_03535 [Robertkochia marina]